MPAPGSVSSCLEGLRQRFYAQDVDSSGELTVEEIVLHWKGYAEARAGHPLTDEEREAIALEVSRYFQDMGIDADGVVSVDEFVHHALISAHPPGAATQEAIALRIRELDDVVNLS